MKHFVLSLPFLALLGCASGNVERSHPNPASPHADAAVAACKSALALREGVNSYMVLPISHVPYGQGQEVFLSLDGKQWICTTDAYGNVNRLEKRS